MIGYNHEIKHSGFPPKFWAMIKLENLKKLNGIKKNGNGKNGRMVRMVMGRQTLVPYFRFNMFDPPGVARTPTVGPIGGGGVVRDARPSSGLFFDVGGGF